MVRRSLSLFTAFIQLMDALVVIGAGLLVHRFYVYESSAGLSAKYSTLILAGGLVVGILGESVYRSWRGGALPAMLMRVAVSWGGAWGLLLVWLVLSKTAQDYSRVWLIGWGAGSLLLLWLERCGVYLMLRYLRSQGYNHKTVLVVGDASLRTSIRRQAHASAWTGYDIIGSLPADHLSEIEVTVARYRPDEIWVGLDISDRVPVQQVLQALRHTTADIRLIPDLFTLQLVNHGVSVVMGFPMLDVSHSPMTGFNRVLKGLEDRLIGALILLGIWPLMLGIAIAIKLTSPGPVLFKQRRHGWNGEEIVIYKFRSMKVHSEADNKVSQAKRHDDRVTPLGRFLRRTSLDELPQFINVVQGRMSIVGPRPHALAHNEHYKDLVPKYMLRHKVKPGITGLAQVNGFRGETDTLEKMWERVRMDLQYIENWSLWLDLKIIVLTVFKGFVHKNAF